MISICRHPCSDSWCKGGNPQRHMLMRLRTSEALCRNHMCCCCSEMRNKPLSIYNAKAIASKVCVHARERSYLHHVSSLICACLCNSACHQVRHNLSISQAALLALLKILSSTLPSSSPTCWQHSPCELLHLSRKCIKKVARGLKQAQDIILIFC